MFSQIAWLTIAAVACLASKAAAFSVTWTSGEKTLQTTEARQCTLLVHSSYVGEAPPPDYRLAWLAESNNSQAVGGIPSSGDAARLPASDLRAHVGLQGFRLETSELSGDALGRLIFRLNEAVPARIIILPQVLGDTATGLAANRLSMEALVNGGTTGSYAPTAVSYQVSASPNGLHLVAIGVGLGRVAKAMLAFPSLPSQVSGKISTHTDNRIVVDWLGTPPTGDGVIELIDERGYTDALTYLAPKGNSPRAAESVVITFAPGILGNIPSQEDAVPLAQFSALSQSLGSAMTSAGVVSLRRLYPWFRHKDTRSVNSLGEPVTLIDLTDTYVATLGSGISATDAAVLLNAMDGVSRADPNLGQSKTLFTPYHPNDSYYTSGAQWGLHNTGQTICTRVCTPDRDINAPEAWGQTKGAGVKLAILDSGLDTTHVEFEYPRARLGATFVPGTTTSFDDHIDRHGTAVAGIAAAAGDNNFGIAGVAYEASPWGIKISGNSGNTPSQFAAGIAWSTANAFPLGNMSVAFDDNIAPPNTVHILGDACLNALNSGELIVAAMGNTNDSLKYWPAALDARTCAVGAVLYDGRRWTDENLNVLDPTAGSCLGSWIDLVAPGGRLITTTTYGPDGFEDLSLCNQSPYDVAAMGGGGTSLAAPVVTGVAGLLKAANPVLTGEDMSNVMKATALRFAGFTTALGWGIVKADAALAFVSSPRLVAHGLLTMQAGPMGMLTEAVAESIQVTKTFTNVPGLTNGTYQCWRHTLRGTAIFNAGFTSAPTVWVRGSTSVGWRDVAGTFDGDQEIMWGRSVFAPSLTAGTFETYVYHVTTGYTVNKGWFPSLTSGAKVAFTAVAPSTMTVGVGEKGDVVAGQLEARVLGNPFAYGHGCEFVLRGVDGAPAGVSLYDIAGRLIARIFDGPLVGGARSVHWNGKDSLGRSVSPGVYFADVRSSNQRMARRVVVVQ